MEQGSPEAALQTLLLHKDGQFRVCASHGAAPSRRAGTDVTVLRYSLRAMARIAFNPDPKRPIASRLRSSSE